MRRSIIPRVLVFVYEVSIMCVCPIYKWLRCVCLGLDVFLESNSRTAVRYIDGNPFYALFYISFIN